jgi:hypothetical protein
MAVSLSTNFVKLFEAEVHQAYQSVQKLAGTCRTRTGVVGSTVQFPKIGAGQATVHIPSTNVSALNVTHSNVTATLSDFVAPEYTSIFDQQKVNYDERSELVQVVSNAIGRRADQIKLDALAAASSPQTVANSIGGSNTNINFAKIRESAKLLNTKNVPASDRYMVIHANGLANLLSEEQATSADYVAAKALLDGSINSYMGFKFIVLGDMDEGGLAVDGSSDRTCFAFHKSALGYAEGIGIKTEINYVPEKAAWLTNCMISAGAVAVDDSGIVKITARES